MNELDIDYVRTRNFLKFTSDIFEHVITPVKSTFGVRELSRIRNLLKMGNFNVDYSYMKFLDPIILRLYKLRDIKVIVDIYEPFPEAAEAYGGSYQGISSTVWKILERYTITNSDIVLTVTEEETENLKCKYRKDNIYTIRNFPDVDIYKPCNSMKFKNFSIVYYGVWSPSRDLTHVTKAIAALQRKYEIDVHIIGQRELLTQVYCKHTFHGWLRNNHAVKIISRCHLGIAPYVDTEHGNLTLQNKSFQYAACNVMPIGTNLKPLRKYDKIIDLVPNTEKSWYEKIKECHKLWKDRDLIFDQREKLIRSGWTANVEWKKLEKYSRKSVE